MFSLYLLLVGEEIRYVGITKRLKKRRAEHCNGYYARYTKNKHYTHWYNKLDAAPEFSVIADGLTKEEALSMETDLIFNLRALGYPLVNLAEYGHISEDHGKKVVAAWERGCYTWCSEEKHLNHLEKIRNDRRYDIECTEKATGNTVIVHGMNAAVELTGVTKGNIHGIMNPDYPRWSSKGWTFTKLN